MICHLQCLFVNWLLPHLFPQAYWLIALLNTIGKALEFIIAKRISYLAETYGFLPPNHFGARLSSSTEHALYYLVERVYATWNKKKIATALLLDVTGAFDNVSKNRLLNNLCIKKIDPRIMNWIGSFLTDRSTILKTNEYTSEKIHISTGIPQGSPLSPILFFFTIYHCWKSLIWSQIHIQRDLLTTSQY